MRRSPEAFLYDIVTKIDRLQAKLPHWSRERLETERDVQAIVERELMIVGEAVYQLSRTAPELVAAISDADQIIRFRHVVVHGYHTLNYNIVWEILVHRMPKLREEAGMLLARFDPPPEVDL